MTLKGAQQATCCNIYAQRAKLKTNRLKALRERLPQSLILWSPDPDKSISPSFHEKCILNYVVDGRGDENKSSKNAKTLGKTAAANIGSVSNEVVKKIYFG
jgi:hypothetical protein